MKCIHKETFSFFKSIHPKQGNNSTKMQGITESEREIEDFRRHRKVNPKQETRDKLPLLFNRQGRRKPNDSQTYQLFNN